jgi:type II secretory ATPase GspE/PulE/Tfp pilus assembly ATPase PilB-like protein
LKTGHIGLGVNQMPSIERASFASALQSILRADPDIM